MRYEGRFARAIVGDQGPTKGLGEGTPKLGWELNEDPKDVDAMSAAQLQDAMKDAQIENWRWIILFWSILLLLTR